jgi:CHAT domain
MSSVIVCGFYTEDYRRWLIPLVASLDRLGQAHDFVLAEKAGSMRETNTMAKAAHILAAMDRHPNEVIVWLDVDCIVLGDLSPLADIRGDVAFRMHSKFRRHHKGTRFRAQSGTMVFRPTAEGSPVRQAMEAGFRAGPIWRDRPVLAGGGDGSVDWHDLCAPAADLLRKPRREGQGAGRCRGARFSGRAFPENIWVEALCRPADRKAGGLAPAASGQRFLCATSEHGPTWRSVSKARIVLLAISVVLEGVVLRVLIVFIVVWCSTTRPATAGQVCVDDPSLAFAATRVHTRIAYDRMGVARAGDVPGQDLGTLMGFTSGILDYLRTQSLVEDARGAAAILYAIDGDDLCAFLWIDRLLAQKLPDDVRVAYHTINSPSGECQHCYHYAVIPGGGRKLGELTNALKTYLTLVGRGASRVPVRKSSDSVRADREDASDAQRNLGTSTVESVTGSTYDLSAILTAASTVLFPPAVQMAMRHAERLTVLPSGGISTFPLYALSPAGDGRRAVEYLTINVAAFPSEINSARTLVRELRPPSPILLGEKSRVRIFGNPFPLNDPVWDFPSLPGALEEARFVRDRVGGVLLTGKNATPDKFLKAATEANLIYVAAHGMASDESPIDGGFIAMHNGRVTARQIQTLTFPRRPLVVLSACQTGIGQAIEAGVIGLARAFQIAGASNTVMSLWIIDDAATKALMTGFVANLNGRSASSALRQAMLATRKDYPDPLLWGSFNVFGAGGILVHW